MASPIANSSCAILALLLLGSLFFTPSSAITKADVTTVCSEAQNASFCSTFLNSIPGLTTKTFKDLALITVDKVLSDMENTNLLIFNLTQQKRVPQEEKALTDCFNSYSEMMEELLLAKALLVRGSSIQIINVAHTTVGLAAQCQKEVQGTTLPFAANNLRIEGYSSVLEILSTNILN